MIIKVQVDGNADSDLYEGYHALRDGIAAHDFEVLSMRPKVKGGGLFGSGDGQIQSFNAVFQVKLVDIPTEEHVAQLQAELRKLFGPNALIVVTRSNGD